MSLPRCTLMRNMRAIHALVCLCIATAKEQRYDPQQLIAMLSVQPSHTQRLIHKASFGLWGEQQNASLWLLVATVSGRRVEFLFVAQPERTRLDCGPEPDGALAVVGILENKFDEFDDTLSRWCLRGDGTGDSRRTRRKLEFQRVSAAPSLQELATKSTGEQCRPRSVRHAGFYRAPGSSCASRKATSPQRSCSGLSTIEVLCTGQSTTRRQSLRRRRTSAPF